MLITRGLGSILEITTHISTSIVHTNLLLELWSELVDPPCFRDDAISSPEGAASSDAVASRDGAWASVIGESGWDLLSDISAFCVKEDDDDDGRSSAPPVSIASPLTLQPVWVVWEDGGLLGVTEKGLRGMLAAGGGGISLALEGASDVVLSFDDESFLRRYFRLCWRIGASVEGRFWGSSRSLICNGFWSLSFVRSESVES